MATMEPATDIKRCVEIEGGKLSKLPWTVTENVVEGVLMVTLTKTDTGFSRFVSGTNKGIIHTSFLDSLRKIRTEATIKACEGLFESTDMTRRAKKALKEQWKNAGAIPQMVDVVLRAKGAVKH